MIDKQIPIHVLYIKNTISIHYMKTCVSLFTKHGYKHIVLSEGFTPDMIEEDGERLDFNDHRIYSDGSKREWLPEEKAIWVSHYVLWQHCVSTNEPIIIAEHDCYLKRPLGDIIKEYDIFSFASTDGNKSIPAVGYYLTPHGARKLISRANLKPIDCPVDAVIHKLQMKRMPFKFDKNFMDKYIFAYHHIDEDVGTTKPRIGKQKNER